MSRATRVVALSLTAATGFAGLAYEVAWQRYLATLLGAQSEATAAVLAIFLGGLSAGYALFGYATRAIVLRSEATGRSPPLLRFYGAVEAAIGVYALLFPWLFRAAQALSLRLPADGGLPAFAADVALAAALIAPPAVLMGGTIPILTQALARDLADATRVHALVYATNTAGAFVGALAAGFALVPWLGLDGLARAMGAINLGAGAAFALLGAPQHAIAPLGASHPPEGASSGARVYAVAALLVGFATMTSETVVIRIGGLTFGSSEFTFAMVVAAFVLAIAIGSLSVSVLRGARRAVLPAVLWALTAMFALLYTRADEAPYWGHVLRTFFTSQAASFHVFFAAAFLATLAVIGPAVALSGAVLPLIFDAQRDEIGDLGAVAGRIYSYNTIGALLGALIGGYALLFWLDLDGVARIALIAFAASAALVTVHRYFAGRPAVIAALFAPVALAMLWLEPWDPGRLSSGLFRVREAQPASYEGPGPKHRPVAFHEDDPTSTVAVTRDEDGTAIIVNGKADGNAPRDLQTMALAALIPALIADDPRRAFVIGFGTGITAGYLAELESTREVTVAEISAGVLGAAPLFDFANHGASHHPKIRFLRTDAYRALRRSAAHYDVIVSEPSNPWAAGVEMLFTREFLAAARERLAPGGVYVQWYHLYENNDTAVRLVLQNFADVFDRVAVWRSQATDLLLIGVPGGDGALDLDRIERRMARPDLRAGLAAVGIHELPELLVHEGLPLGVVNTLPRADGPIHSLFHPRLSYEAGRGFFVGAEAELPFFGSAADPLVRRESLLRRYLSRYSDEIPEAVWRAMIDRACAVKLPHCPTLISAWAAQHHSPEEIRARLAELYQARNPQMRFDLLPVLRFFYADPGMDYEGGPPEEIEQQMRAYRARYYHALPFPPGALVALWKRCRGDQGGFGPRCQRGLREAQRYAMTGHLPSFEAGEAGTR